MKNKLISVGGIIIIAMIVIITLISTYSLAELHYNKDNINDKEIDIGQTSHLKTEQSIAKDTQLIPSNFTETYKCKGNAKCISGFVTRIIDGDTIVVDDKSIRFSLVNTPEWGNKDYFQSGHFIETICPVGSRVLIDEDDGQTQRSFGRIIGKIFCNGIILNEEILESGHAVILTKFCPVSEFANEPWAQKFGC